MADNQQKEDSLDPITRIILDYRREAREAKQFRMDLNRDNFDMYHLRKDWQHKKRGQSKEILAKQSIAVEQIASFMQQGLVDQDRWFGVKALPGHIDTLFTEDVIFRLLQRQLNKNDISKFINHKLKLGLLGSLMITKVHGEFVEDVDFQIIKQESEKKLFRTTKPVWKLKLDLIRQEDFFPDPTGRGLYECQVIWMDWHKLLEIAEKHPTVYDVNAVKNLSGFSDEEQRHRKARETGQNTTITQTRKLIKITECWGSFVDQSTGKVITENAVAAIANDNTLIRPPQSNPFWHGESPFVATPIITVPHSVWHKALMDAPTKLNRALIELYNLMLDAGIMGAFGIRQLREDWLDPAQDVSDGIPPGETLLVTNSAPPGAKVMETVATGSLAPESLQMFGITDREFQQAAITNDLRLGNFPERSTKATEIVSVEQNIRGIFGGIIKTIESDAIAKILNKSWKVIAQHMNDLDADEVKAALGEEAALELQAVSNEERFANTVGGISFKVFGLSQTLNKIQDFRKIQALLQTISGSEVLTREFQRKYSFNKLLTEIVKSLDIDTSKIELDPQEQEIIQQEEQQRMAMEMAQQQGQQQQGQPDMQSQIPQATTGAETNLVDIDRARLLAGITEPQ